MRLNDIFSILGGLFLPKPCNNEHEWSMKHSTNSEPPQAVGLSDVLKMITGVVVQALSG